MQSVYRVAHRERDLAAHGLAHVYIKRRCS